MKLVVTIDVEEEGLFSNHYDSRNISVNNVPELERLDPIFREWGIHPTLLVTYPVVNHEPHRDLLLQLKEKWRAEIGAHLHPWNTPPLEPLPYPEPVPSDLIPRELLAAKFDTLMHEIKGLGIAATSFRMGRFNMGPKMFSVIESAGIRVDSSIAPMRRYYGGPDHLSAMTEPYFPDPENPLRAGASSILEVPMTILPMVPSLGHWLEYLLRKSICPEKWISWIAMNPGSIPVQPVWTGLRRLKAGVKLHQMRGGSVLTIFFHSSELMPGGYPDHPTPASIDRFLEKLAAFFGWLHTDMAVESVTLSQLAESYRQSA
jgi:hypothetical protein